MKRILLELGSERAWRNVRCTVATIHKFLGGKICYDEGINFLLHRHAKRFVSVPTIVVIHVLRGTKA